MKHIYAIGIQMMRAAEHRKSTENELAKVENRIKKFIRHGKFN